MLNNDVFGARPKSKCTPIISVENPLYDAVELHIQSVSPTTLNPVDDDLQICFDRIVDEEESDKYDSYDNDFCLDRQNFDNVIYTGLNDDLKLYNRSYFNPPSVSDTNVPLSHNSFASISNFSPPSVFLFRCSCKNCFIVTKAALRCMTRQLQYLLKTLLLLISTIMPD